MFKSNFVRKLAVPVILTKSMFITSCNNQIKNPQAIVQETSLEAELKELEKEYKQQRITAKDFAFSIYMIFAKSKSQNITKSLTKYKKMADDITRVLKENVEEVEKILTMVTKQKKLEEPFSEEQIDEVSTILAKSLLLGTVNKEKVNRLIFAMVNHDHKLAKKNLKNLTQSIQKNLSESNNVSPEFIKSAAGIILNAVRNQVIDAQAALQMTSLIKNLNPIINKVKLISTLINKLDNKALLSEKEIQDYTKEIEALQKKKLMSRDEASKNIKLLKHFNQLVKSEEVPIDVKELVAEKRTVLNKVKNSYNHYLNKNINPDALLDTNSNNKSKKVKKTLRKKTSNKAQKDSLNKIKTFAEENSLNEIKFSSIAKGRIISQKEFIKLLKFFNKFDISKLKSVTPEEKDIINKIQRIIKKHGLTSIIKEHLIGETLNLKEIEAMLSITSKLKK